MNRDQRCQLNRRGNDVVGRLPQVHVVVGVHDPGPQVSAQYLGRDVGDDLVGVGVGRRARPGLEDVQHEMVVILPVNHPLGRLDDGVAYRLVQDSHFHVRLRRRLLDQSQCTDESPREPQIADGEVQHRPHRRRPVESVSWDLHFPHGVAFYPRVAHCHQNTVLDSVPLLAERPIGLLP